MDRFMNSLPWLKRKGIRIGRLPLGSLLSRLIRNAMREEIRNAQRRKEWIFSPGPKVADV
jgi:hypothetical protein